MSVAQSLRARAIRFADVPVGRVFQSPRIDAQRDEVTHWCKVDNDWADGHGTANKNERCGFAWDETVLLFAIGGGK